MSQSLKERKRPHPVEPTTPRKKSKLTRTGTLIFDECTIPDNLFTLLPDELVLHIFSFFGAKSLACVDRVCHKWHGLANDNDVWKSLIKREQGASIPPLSYKSLYQSKAMPTSVFAKDAFCNLISLYYSRLTTQDFQEDFYRSLKKFAVIITHVMLQGLSIHDFINKTLAQVQNYSSKAHFYIVQQGQLVLMLLYQLASLGSQKHLSNGSVYYSWLTHDYDEVLSKAICLLTKRLPKYYSINSKLKGINFPALKFAIVKPVLNGRSYAIHVPLITNFMKYGADVSDPKSFGLTIPVYQFLLFQLMTQMAVTTDIYPDAWLERLVHAFADKNEILPTFEEFTTNCIKEKLIEDSDYHMSLAYLTRPYFERKYQEAIVVQESRCLAETLSYDTSSASSASLD